MGVSKISLSPAELELFCNAEVILTKNSVLQKTIALLEEVQEVVTLEKPLHQSLPFGSPKISKGENYLGLPYLILDYPRISEGGNLFFIRSMFWWGKFFSSTLQVAGSFKERFEEKIKSSYKGLGEMNYFLGVNEDPWLHHFEEENFLRISSLSEDAFALIIEERSHLKIATHWPLSEWNDAKNKLVESWMFLMSLTPTLSPQRGS